MAKTFKLAVAAALVVGAITAWQLGTAPLLPPTDGAAAGGNAAAVAAVSGSAPTQSPATGREDLLTASLAGPDLAHPFEYELRCRVLDDHGLPAIGESVAITPLGCTENVWPAKTEWGGPLVVQWHGRSESMRVAVRVGAGPPHEFEVRARAPREITLLASGPSFQRLDVQFSAADFEVVGTADSADKSRVLRVLGNRIRGNHDVLAPASGMHPERLFCDRLLGGETPANGVPVLSRLPIVSSLFLEVGGIERQVLLQETATPAAPTGAIEGIVFGEDGEPASGVLVCCCPTHDEPLQRAQTDADGTFRFEGLPLQSFELRAGGGPEGLARTSTLATANGASTATLQLHREQTIRGTALGRSRGPLSDWIVDYEALDGTWVDRATVGQDGGFVLANLPAGPGRLLLRQRPELLAAAIVPSVLPDSGEVAFALADDADPRGAIALRLPPESDGSVPAASFRAWQLDSNSAAALAPAKDGSLRIDNLPAGYYRIEGGIDGRGSSDLGTHYVDGKSTLDLGTIAPPMLGTLRLLHRPAHVAIELYQRRASGDIRCLRDPGDEDELQLPAGNWLLFCKVGDEPARALPFALQPGASTEVDLGR